MELSNGTDFLLTEYRNYMEKLADWRRKISGTIREDLEAEQGRKTSDDNLSSLVFSIVHTEHSLKCDKTHFNCPQGKVFI